MKLSYNGEARRTTSDLGKNFNMDSIPFFGYGKIKLFLKIVILSTSIPYNRGF